MLIGDLFDKGCERLMAVMSGVLFTFFTGFVLTDCRDFSDFVVSLEVKAGDFVAVESFVFGLLGGLGLEASLNKNAPALLLDLLSPVVIDADTTIGSV